MEKFLVYISKNNNLLSTIWKIIILVKYNK